MSFANLKSHGRKAWHPTLGRHRLLDPDGYVHPWSEWMPNAVLDEGEYDCLNVWLAQAADLSKYLCLLKGSAPAETDTMAFLAANENFNPPLNGYARIQIAAGDWATPTLDSGDMKTTHGVKTFGPASSSAWTSLTGVGVVTAATGQTAGSGKFLIYQALSGTTTINIGQSFQYQLGVKLS